MALTQIMTSGMTRHGSSPKAWGLTIQMVQLAHMHLLATNLVGLQGIEPQIQG